MRGSLILVKFLFGIFSPKLVRMRLVMVFNSFYGVLRSTN